MDNQQIETSVQVSKRKICPACKNGELRRKERKKWMSWIPSSKYYSCSQCRAGFLRLFDFFQFKLIWTSGKSRNIKREFAIVAFVIITAVYVCWKLVIRLYDIPVQQ